MTRSTNTDSLREAIAEIVRSTEVVMDVRTEPPYHIDISATEDLKINNLLALFKAEHNKKIDELLEVLPEQWDEMLDQSDGKTLVDNQSVGFNKALTQVREAINKAREESI